LVWWHRLCPSISRNWRTSLLCILKARVAGIIYCKYCDSTSGVALGDALGATRLSIRGCSSGSESSASVLPDMKEPADLVDMKESLTGLFFGRCDFLLMHKTQATQHAKSAHATQMPPTPIQKLLLPATPKLPRLENIVLLLEAL